MRFSCPSNCWSTDLAVTVASSTGTPEVSKTLPLKVAFSLISDVVPVVWRGWVLELATGAAELAIGDAGAAEAVATGVVASALATGEAGVVVVVVVVVVVAAALATGVAVAVVLAQVV